MSQVYRSLTTGLEGLDAVLCGVRPGDNIVLQVDSIQDYVPFVRPFAAAAAREGRPLVYFRFADHEPLLDPDVPAHTVPLHPEQGFETFIDEIFDVIEKQGRGACYVFDCLSELAVDWYSDRMLGNFFMLACPYLYDYETATFFALQKNVHSPHAINAIHGTAQVVVDVFRDGGGLYVQPQKVYKRHSDTMYTLHRWEPGGSFVPVRQSATISAVLGAVPHPWLDFSVHHLDIWSRTFTRAQEAAEAERAGGGLSGPARALYDRLLRMAFSRDPRLLDLAERYIGIADLVEVGRRMIGTGLIGGKSAGMLLARAILQREDPAWRERLGAHDSFYIGSDVFYTYLIRNGCWWVRRKLKDPEALFDTSEEVRERLLSGSFPEDIMAQFTAMLNYFGQSPIIVRSSSLLEDAYGNAFSGKYESVFCANQGTPQERLERFTAAVREVYASTMSHEALSYRAHRGLLDKDEQMALLVQRVSGAAYGDLYFPQVAGVGFSFNPYVWSPDIDPRAGVLRLVFGLGTRAVDRSDDDYTRLVSLGAPGDQPHGVQEDPQRYSQHKADVLDLRQNRLLTMPAGEVMEQGGAALPRERLMSPGPRGAGPGIFTFDSLLSDTAFTADLRRMLATLETAYRHPVDIEFTANSYDGGEFRVNLLQCRPFQVRRPAGATADIGSIPEQRVVLRTAGPVIGNSFSAPLDRVIYVVPAAYSALGQQQQHGVARLIGRIAHLDSVRGGALMLVGPGRWGTSTPSLGVPARFAEVNTVRVLVELALMHAGLIPDVSLGTHFFNDLVETDMLYMAVSPERAGALFCGDFFEGGRNLLPDLLPDAASWQPVVRVLDAAAAGLFLHADPLQQRAICFLRGRSADGGEGVA